MVGLNHRLVNSATSRRDELAPVEERRRCYLFQFLGCTKFRSCNLSAQESHIVTAHRPFESTTTTRKERPLPYLHIQLHSVTTSCRSLKGYVFGKRRLAFKMTESPMFQELPPSVLECLSTENRFCRKFCSRSTMCVGVVVAVIIV